MIKVNMTVSVLFINLTFIVLATYQSTRNLKLTYHIHLIIIGNKCKIRKEEKVYNTDLLYLNVYIRKEYFILPFLYIFQLFNTFFAHFRTFINVYVYKHQYNVLYEDSLERRDVFLELTYMHYVR